jgi:glycerophosphoryl diester phosphodiesterase
MRMRIQKISIGLLVLALAACTASKPTTTSVKANHLDKQGHRGGRGLMPENTIPAMLNGMDLGVTTLEMDVVISKDNQVVVSHDVYFNENITTTPEGNYLTRAEAPQRLIYTMPYDSIRKYDVGLKPHPDFPRQEKIPAYKPLLSELLDSTEAYARKKGQAIAYNIEIKSKPENDGKKHPPVEEFVDLAMQVIRQKDVQSRCTIQSFDPRALQVIHKKYPGTITSLLIEGNDHRSLEEQVKELGFIPSAYSPHFSLVTPELVKQCHEKNITVIPWTVNSLEEMKKLRQLGVDGIISDYPDLFAQL